MKVSTKLYLCFGALVVQIFIVLALLKIETRQQTEFTNSLSETNVEPMVIIGGLIGEIYRARVNLRDALFAKLANKPESEISKFQNTYREMAQNADDKFKALDEVVDAPRRQKALDAAKAGWVDLKTVVGKVEAATMAGDHSTAIELMLTQCITAANATITALNDLLALQEEIYDEKVLEEDKYIGKLVLSTIAIMLGLTAITVFFGIKTIRDILGGLGKAVEVSTQIGQGNLTSTIEVQGNDEISQLMKSLKSMSTSLRGLIKNVLHSTESLTNNSASLRTASEEMSKAATEQADATSSMAAAVEELSVSIGQITENSTEASATATEAQQSADEGMKSLNNVVQSIRSISEAVDGSAESVKAVAKQSEEISEIVSTITEIADRTNLLALNAAIEAARAGESGRGFAVVADEVRKLAEQTKGATDRISSMVGHIQLTTKEASERMDESVNRVKEGITQADTVSETIHNIRHNAEAVNQAIQAIAVSMKEQTNVSFEIGRNVERVAQMTEENTASIQQNRDVAEQISDSSLSLSESVKVFKL